VVGAAGLALIGYAPAAAQTLPIAGDAAQAVAQDQADRNAIERANDRADRDAVRGVREQDNAALRTANRLNRDLRQEARQDLNQAVGQSAALNRDTTLRPGFDGSFRDMSAMNSGVRGADLGLWFNSRPGMNG